MGSVSLSCSHCSAASIHCNIAVVQSEIRTPNSTKYRTIRNKMSYYRVRDCYDDMLHQRRQRSCSLPREDLGYARDRHIRARSVGPVDHFSSAPAMPFRSRAVSIPPFDYLELSRSRYARNISPLWPNYEYPPRLHSYDYEKEFYRPRPYFYDYHDYLPSSYYSSSFEPRIRYYDYNHKDSYGYDNHSSYYDNHSNYYDNHSSHYDNHNSYDMSLLDYYTNNKYNDYAYSSSADVLGRWKHYNRSIDTLNSRNNRATSPLVSRELNRYFSSAGKTDSVADLGSRGALDFRHYNYRSVPYFGTSDNFHNLNKMFQEQNRREG